MKTVAFFNNKGGVGKTSLVYHLAWMLADMGHRLIVADFDPQANLTSMFLDEDRLEEVWPDGPHDKSILGSINPLITRTGDVAPPHVEAVSDNIGLIIGDLGLSGFEDELSSNWSGCADGKEAAFRVISSFHRILAAAAKKFEAEFALIDVGPNLGAINRAALISADYVVVPLAPDLFSLQALRNLGPTFRTWRQEWMGRRARNPVPSLDLSLGTMTAVGYVAMQHAVRLDRPVKAYDKWMRRIPGEYRRWVLNDAKSGELSMENDDNCLASLKHYRSLMPLAMEAHKPMFSLSPADGAIGAHQQAVEGCFRDFKALAGRILSKIGDVNGS